VAGHEHAIVTPRPSLYNVHRLGVGR